MNLNNERNAMSAAVSRNFAGLIGAVANGAATAPLSWPRKVDLFGVGVSPTTYKEATEIILQAARHRIAAVVACQAVHAVVTASCDPSLRDQVNSFELVTPDGQPVRWALNLLYRTQLAERVYGPELMLRLCRGAAERAIPIYLYGGTPEVLAKLQANLCQACPNLQIVGCESPPFRALTPPEDRAVIERINASGAGLVFLGLGCPKQDRFAFAHRSSIKAVQVCVGAAFDFHAGVKKMAPTWMQRHGLEWLYRLFQEPGRLWRRYLVTNSLFLAKLLVALSRRQPISHSTHCRSHQRPAGGAASEPLAATGTRER
jgi:N-acetylglucosaminyldiphosphoundecaprenol N-acetyl-beta-D-mannosaminyltransferase